MAWQMCRSLKLVFLKALLQRLQNTKPSIDPRAWDEEEVDRQALDRGLGDDEGIEVRIAGELCGHCMGTYEVKGIELGRG